VHAKRHAWNYIAVNTLKSSPDLVFVATQASIRYKTAFVADPNVFLAIRTRGCIGRSYDYAKRHNPGTSFLHI
jgi:hypothetical protein